MDADCFEEFYFWASLSQVRLQVALYHQLLAQFELDVVVLVVETLDGLLL